MLDDYTRHQQGIIKRYYRSLDKVAVNKLSELLTELYLADGKKLDKLWKSAEGHMQKAGVQQGRIDAIMEKEDLNLLAELVKQLNAGG